MNTLFIAALLMSTTGALLLLCMSLLRPVTKRWFNAAWHYRLYILVLLFLLIPIGAVGGGVSKTARIRFTVGGASQAGGSEVYVNGGGGKLDGGLGTIRDWR